MFPAFRETGRGTNEFERLPKRRSPRHVSLRSPRRGAGKLRSQRARDRKRALQVVIIRGPGADSHVVRSRRTALRLPLRRLRCKVKLWIRRLREMSIPGNATVRFLIVRARMLARASFQQRSSSMFSRNDSVRVDIANFIPRIFSFNILFLLFYQRQFYCNNKMHLLRIDRLRQQKLIYSYERIFTEQNFSILPAK